MTMSLNIQYFPIAPFFFNVPIAQSLPGRGSSKLQFGCKVHSCHFFNPKLAKMHPTPLRDKNKQYKPFFFYTVKMPLLHR
ncbi:hypothetical protein BDA96_01G432700 [Sorghum bicolor]|uniref:Uncharacterized protein n=2 Tax=Sorghum bicolor TaxID=4558 RepID=A0A921S4Z6_SORBI|nr:hypothetical protein BDA96_01G432700 [Sorghum bicolor]KXG39583.1 hypothetical protein SORBI_3001G406200 [Sorghum bicolor]